MRRVIIESPFGSRVDGSRASSEEIVENVAYLRVCMRDSFCRGEAPFASHGIYPHVLNDLDAEERALGMKAGFAWGEVAVAVVVYTDRGITPGMNEGIRRAHERGASVEYRSLGR